MHVYECVCHMCAGVLRGQREVSDTLELDFQLRCPTGMWGIKLRSSGEAARSINPLAISLDPYIVFWKAQGDDNVIRWGCLMK